jgi:hypothetical protein
LTTNVESENLIKLSTRPLRKGKPWNNAEKDLTMDFESPDAQNAYINLRTNNHSDYFINLLGTPLSVSAVSSKIGYTITPISGTGYSIGDPLIVDASHVNDSVVYFVTFPGTSGMRVVPAKFSVELNESDWNSASEGDYTATVQFPLSTT